MTSESIRSNYSRQEYETAKKTRDLHAKIGYPLAIDFKKIIKHGLVHNCDVTTKDVDNATEMFGKSIFKLKGKTTRKKPDLVIEDFVSIPKSIGKRHQDVSLCINLMFVQNLPMMVTVSKTLKFTTIKTFKISFC